MELDFHPHNQVILSELKKGKFEEQKKFELLTKASTLRLDSGFQRLISPDTFKDWQPFEHQKATALKVIKELRGRALLADEVGLGKTVEAGLILKEYMLRGLARRVLILTPASLVTQWQEELHMKFGLDFSICNKVEDWARLDRIVASIDTAKRSPHSDQILKLKYDLVIIDEAHKLKNSATLGWRFVDKIKKKYILMLTATPVQNDLEELFNMITLLKPGQLKTFEAFKEEFMEDRLSPKNAPRLKQLLSDVMIRNRRRATGIVFPKRDVKTVMVDLSSEEREFYEGITEYIRKSHLERRGSPLSFVTLEKLACSSTRGAAGMLNNMLKNQKLSQADFEALYSLYKMAVSIRENRKAQVVKDLIGELDEKVIIFTEFRQTQEFLTEELGDAGISVVTFHGGMKYQEKDEAIDEFRGSKDVLISTEAGGEGRNLQFCSNLINYDLPWNPMKLEQRIGRVHRLGQKKDVRILNLAAAETIEAYILYLLDKKINMFQLVVGELDMIISNIEGKGSFEESLFQILIQSKNQEDMEERIEEFGKKLEEARENYRNITLLDEEIFG